MRISDWSSDVCSSDLYRPLVAGTGAAQRAAHDDRHRGRDARARGGDPRGAERLMAIARVAIVGLGLIGSSIARAIRERLTPVTGTGHDPSDDVRGVARELGVFGTIVADEGSETSRGG